MSIHLDHPFEHLTLITYDVVHDVEYQPGKKLLYAPLSCEFMTPEGAERSLEQLLPDYPNARIAVRKRFLRTEAEYDLELKLLNLARGAS